MSHICLTFEYACQDQLNSQPLMIYKHQHEPFGVKCEEHQTTREELDSKLGAQTQQKQTMHACNLMFNTHTIDINTLKLIFAMNTQNNKNICKNTKDTRVAN